MHVTTPATEDEFARYFELRWQVLRRPWSQPPGSERDELEADAEHAVIWDPAGSAIAAGRLHFNTATEAQIRYMAVSPSAQGRGLGRLIVEHLESIARHGRAETIVLNSRASAVGFYERLGFHSTGAAAPVFGIPHVRMTKLI
jgi:predicted GNAT family N-acyltransferase